jgi:hypothetical protein
MRVHVFVCVFFVVCVLGTDFCMCFFVCACWVQIFVVLTFEYKKIH